MSCALQATGFAFESAHDAIEVLLSRVVAVEQERVGLQDAAGRVLGQPIHADRDSPPSDVSAMDGYAVRADQVKPGEMIGLLGEIAIGQPAPIMPSEGCLKIGTGACVPTGCDGIIARELVDESNETITLHHDLTFEPGQHIRRQGENTRRDHQIATAGTAITPPLAAALAAFGQASVQVFRPVRVAILTTGDELHPVASSPDPWQIRDSNGTTLNNALAPLPWVDVVLNQHVTDDQEALTAVMQSAATEADLIITTGGVSMGDRDCLKPALLQAGGEVVYHKLPIRPGKPSLGGLISASKASNQLVPIAALPGNPVAVTVGVPLFVGPIARKLAGMKGPTPPRPVARLNNPPKKRLSLWRYLPVRWRGDGEVDMLATQGSGDLAGAALAEGYIEVPPDEEGSGPWAFYEAAL